MLGIDRYEILAARLRGAATSGADRIEISGTEAVTCALALDTLEYRVVDAETRGFPMTAYTEHQRSLFEALEAPSGEPADAPRTFAPPPSSKPVLTPLEGLLYQIGEDAREGKAKRYPDGGLSGILGGCFWLYLPAPTDATNPRTRSLLAVYDAKSAERLYYGSGESVEQAIRV